MTTLISLCQNAALLALGVLAFSLARPTMERRPAALATLCAGTFFGRADPARHAGAPDRQARLHPRCAQHVGGARGRIRRSHRRLDGRGSGRRLPHRVGRSGHLGGALWARRLDAAGLGAPRLGCRRGRAVKIPELAGLGAAISIGFVPYVLLIPDAALRSLVLQSMRNSSCPIALGLCAFGMLILNGDRRRGCSSRWRNAIGRCGARRARCSRFYARSSCRTEAWTSN